MKQQLAIVILALSSALALSCSDEEDAPPATTTGGSGGTSPQGGGGGLGGASGTSPQGGGGGVAGTVAGMAGMAGGSGGTGAGTGGTEPMDSGTDDAAIDASTDAMLPDDAGEPEACNMAFINAGKCNPEIEFQNDEADGDGAMFDQVIDDPEGTLAEIACQVCTILYRDPSEVTKEPDTIRLRIYDFEGVANAGGGNINFSSRHIANYDEPDDARFEYLGVLIHEVTHLYQFDDGGGGLVEGMADFVRIRAGHHRMNRRSPGGAWTDAYTTSGFFFSWLAGPGGLQTDGRMPSDPDIGWAINKQMKDSWSEQVFVDRLGADVDTLWEQYQDALE